MKTSKITKLLLSLPLLALPLASQAQTVYTDPVGAVVQNVSAGAQLMSVPFQKEKLYQGAVTSITGTTIGLDSVPALGTSAYLQVISGTAEGRLSTIASSTGSSVTLESTISGLAEGDVVAIRDHTTLADVANFIIAQDGDVINLYNPDGSFITGEFYEGFGWYDTDNDEIIDGYIVKPGEGFLVNASSSRDATFMGSVSTDVILYDYAGSYTVNLIANLNPVGGQSIGSLFPFASEGDFVTIYQSVAGTLQIAGSGEFYDGFGFYDSDADEIIDSTLVGTATAVVYQSVVSGVAAVEAAN